MTRSQRAFKYRLKEEFLAHKTVYFYVFSVTILITAIIESIVLK